jgi:hypothetical protein
MLTITAVNGTLPYQIISILETNDSLSVEKICEKLREKYAVKESSKRFSKDTIGATLNSLYKDKKVIRKKDMRTKNNIYKYSLNK